MTTSSLLREAEKEVLEERIARLRRLTFAEVAALPATAGEETLVAGRKRTVTVYIYSVAQDQLLVIVQVARIALFGVAFHHERGLVFSKDGSVREATQAELIDSGG